MPAAPQDAPTTAPIPPRIGLPSRAHRKLDAPMAFLFVFGLPAVLFSLIGRAVAPAGPTTAGISPRRIGADLMRGLRVCAMTSPQFLEDARAAE